MSGKRNAEKRNLMKSHQSNAGEIANLNFSISLSKQRRLQFPGQAGEGQAAEVIYEISQPLNIV